MKTSEELYEAYRQITDQCKENICRELERIGRSELYFDDPFPILVDDGFISCEPTHKIIASIRIYTNGRLYGLYTEDEYEIQPEDVYRGEWLYIWQIVEEECKSIPTAYYTEIAYHDRKNNRLIYDLGEDIEETKVGGEKEAKEQLIYNYEAFIVDNTPLDYLPIFFLCTKESGEYKRRYAILGDSIAESMGYTPKEILNLKKSFKTPMIWK